ncbi:MAG: cell division protein FtsA [Opitutales bacterium]|nr:cell division protein FtsA [Opitutales bacterium]
MPRNKIIGAVEIGSSKITVLIGEIEGGRELNIIGSAEATSVGVKKGEIVDLSSVGRCTHAALIAAERKAGVQVDEVFLSASGAHLEGFTNIGTVNVHDADNWVSEHDVHTAGHSARRKALPPGRCYLVHIRGAACADGREVDNPVGMQAAKLELKYWNVHADERRITDMIHIISGYADGLSVEEIIPASVASGRISASDDERRAGALVVDIGEGTTDFVLYRKGHIVHTGVIPVGGGHLTNDLSIGLRITFKQAERLKLRDGKAVLEKGDKEGHVMLEGDLQIGDRPIPRLAIAKILNARVAEIFSIIKNRLGSAVSAQAVPGGVILTGGSSELPGIADVGRDVLGVDTRVGTHPAWVTREDLRDPGYSTTLGLLFFGLQGQSLGERKAEAPKAGLLRRLFK